MAIRYLDEPNSTSKITYLDEPPAPAQPKRFGGGADLAKSFALGGAPALSMTPGAEEALPAIGQTLGQTAGFPGSVGGASIGIGARDVIKGAREGNFKPAMQFGVNPGLGFSDPKRLAETGVTAVTEGAFRGAGKVLKKPLESVAGRMMNSVIKPNSRILKRNPRFGLDALEAGIVGNRNQMVAKSEDLISGGEKTLDQILNKNTGKVNPKIIARQLGDLKKPFSNVGDEASVEGIKQVQKALRGKGDLSLKEANQLKRDLYKVVKETSYGKGVGEISSKQSAMKQAAGGLKRAIESSAPEVKAVNKKIGTAVTAKDALENAIANSQRTVLLPKLAGMGAGSLAAAGNIPAAIGVLAGDTAISYLRSAPFVTGTAKNLMRLGKSNGTPLRILASEGSRRIFGGG